MKDKLKEFFETELHYTKVGLEHETDLKRRNDIVWYARQRGVGASEFAQMCGLSYNEAEDVFNWYCDELKGMEEDVKMCGQ